MRQRPRSRSGEKVVTSLGCSRRTFRVLYCNAASLLNKLDELSTYVFDCKPDFVAVCETCGNETLTDCFFDIPGYELKARRDRKDTTGGIGGGLIIYAKSDISGNVTEVNCEEFDKFNQISVVRIGLAGENEITLALLYRPHHIYDNKVPHFERTANNNAILCNLFKNIPKPFVMVADMNYSNIDWLTLSGDGNTADFINPCRRTSCPNT